MLLNNFADDGKTQARAASPRCKKRVKGLLNSRLIHADTVIFHFYRDTIFQIPGR